MPVLRILAAPALVFSLVNASPVPASTAEEPVGSSLITMEDIADLLTYRR